MDLGPAENELKQLNILKFIYTCMCLWTNVDIGCGQILMHNKQ